MVSPSTLPLLAPGEGHAVAVRTSAGPNVNSSNNNNINKPHQSESDQEYVMIGANSDLLGCNLGYLLPMIKWRI